MSMIPCTARRSQRPAPAAWRRWMRRGSWKPKRLRATEVIPVTGGRVVSIGVDLVDVGRIREVLARHAQRLASRVLTEKEAEYCLGRPDPAPHVAARFAAKEAVIKCLGGACAFRDIEVVRALSGFPSITLRG